MLSRIFSSHIVSFLLFVSRPADIPDNSFPTPFPTWLPISRCNCHLREDLSIGLNAAFSMRTGGTAPRPRFRETCEISVATCVYTPGFYTRCLKTTDWDWPLKIYWFSETRKKNSNSKRSKVSKWRWLDWLLVAIIPSRSYR